MAKNNRDNPNMAADAVSLVHEYLLRAIDAGASDVHFEPIAQEMIVKFRLDGQLRIIEHLPGSLADNIVARLKVLGGLLTYRNDIPQEGRLELRDGLTGKVRDQRLAVFPTVYGQRAVVRLFYEEALLENIDQLGFNDPILAALKRIAAGNQQVLLVTGPAGSGKSTTLGAILRYILDRFPGKSVVSLEDPVERRISGVTQVEITPHGQLTFPVALRSLLRQDPEVLMIGEIRDSETARMVIEAGLTGHLLLSTMHSGSPATAILRLLEMGIEPYQVTSSVAAVVNQRLVRRLCPQCKRPADADTFAAVGCPACFHTGYKGRVLLAEMIELDGALRRAILDQADMEQLEDLAEKRGHMTLEQDGMRLVHAGITSRQELQRLGGSE